MPRVMYTDVSALLCNPNGVIVGGHEVLCIPVRLTEVALRENGETIDFGRPCDSEDDGELSRRDPDEEWHSYGLRDTLGRGEIMTLLFWELVVYVHDFRSAENERKSIVACLLTHR